MLRNLLLASPFMAVALIFAYESVAVLFPNSGIPSISKIVSSRIGGPPDMQFAEGVITGVVFGVVTLMLLLHFSRLLPWWRP